MKTKNVFCFGLSIILLFGLCVPSTWADCSPLANGMSSLLALNGMKNPDGVAVDAVHNRSFVADQQNNRVLVFNTAKVTTGMSPSNVLGQPNFTSTTAIFPPTQSGLNLPYGVAYDAVNDRLFVTEFGNNRVLVFNTASITNGMNAANVLGEPTFGSFGPATTQSKMWQPRGIAYDRLKNQLFVADTVNTRVLVFNTSTITNGMNAANVLGQADFTSKNPAITQSGMIFPMGVACDPINKRLFVADTNNSRVLIFDTSAITNGMQASNVLGQINFTSANSATSQSGMNNPSGVAYDDTNDLLYVVDSYNNRVLVFDATAVVNGMNASYVLGQAVFTSNATGVTLSNVNLGAFNSAVASDPGNNRLFVSDPGNNRILMFDVCPPSHINQPPSVSIGSPQNGTSFTAPATVSISANATDNDGTIAKVEFFNGTTKLGEATASPYVFSWANVSAGNYSLSAKATDNSGAMTTSTVVNIIVNPPNDMPPTVALVSPSNAATYTSPAIISVRATASDSDGHVTQVQFFANGNVIGTAQTAPYNFTWTNVASGSYVIEAQATDNGGANSLSSPVTVTVSDPAPVTPPSGSGPLNTTLNSVIKSGETGCVLSQVSVRVYSRFGNRVATLSSDGTKACWSPDSSIAAGVYIVKPGNEKFVIIH